MKSLFFKVRRAATKGVAVMAMLVGWLLVGGVMAPGANAAAAGFAPTATATVVGSDLLVHANSGKPMWTVTVHWTGHSETVPFTAEDQTMDYTVHGIPAGSLVEVQGFLHWTPPCPAGATFCLPPSDTTLSLATVTMPEATDDDGDHIPNASDTCPGTPAGAVVNEHGCAFNLPPRLEIKRLVPQDGTNLGQAVFSVTSDNQVTINYQVRVGNSATGGVTYEQPVTVMPSKPAGLTVWRPAGNYTISLGAAGQWIDPVPFSIGLNPPPALTAPAPTFDDALHQTTIPDFPGLTYQINGVDATPGAHATEGKVTVTVKADKTVVVLVGTTTWTHEFPVVVTPTTPPAPTFSDRDHTTTIPSVEGVVYQINGVDATPGAHPTEGKVAVTAHGVNGTKLSGTTTWEHVFPVVVTPKPTPTPTPAPTPTTKPSPPVIPAPQPVQTQQPVPVTKSVPPTTVVVQVPVQIPVNVKVKVHNLTLTGGQSQKVTVPQHSQQGAVHQHLRLGGSMHQAAGGVDTTPPAEVSPMAVIGGVGLGSIAIMLAMIYTRRRKTMRQG